MLTAIKLYKYIQMLQREINKGCCCCCCCWVASGVSNSVRPHRWQPTSLLCPWDSPGKNTGVSGLSFPSPMHESEKWKWSHSVMSDSWRPHGLQPTRLLHPWDFPGKSAAVGCHCLLQLCPWGSPNRYLCNDHCVDEISCSICPQGTERKVWLEWGENTGGW